MSHSNTKFQIIVTDPKTSKKYAFDVYGNFEDACETAETIRKEFKTSFVIIRRFTA